MSTTGKICRAGFITLTALGLGVGACSSDDNSGGNKTNTPDASTNGDAGSVNTNGFQITSPAFTAGQPLPDTATCSGKAFGGGSSPELDWTNGPAGTLSYAIVLKDFSAVETAVPDHAYHWSAWDIPASFLKLPASVPATQSLPGMSPAQQWEGGPTPGGSYFGPCPAWMTFCDPSIPVEEDSYAFIIYAIGSATASVPAMPASGNYVHTLDDYFQSIALGSAELHFTSNAVPTSVPFPCPPLADAATTPTDATSDVVVNDSAASDSAATDSATSDAVAKDAEENADATDAAHE